MITVTIADIARETGIAESTLRFYRDKFAHYIPSIGEGRKRRYETLAVEIFKEIANLSNKGLPVSDIEQYLSERYPHNPIIVDEFSTATTAVTAMKQQETENSVISITPENTITATNPQTAVTAVEPQQILSLMEILARIVPKKEPEKMYCTAKEAAFRTGFSQEFIKKCCREYLKTGKGIPCVRTGRGYVIHKGMLDTWFSKIITLGGKDA